MNITPSIVPEDSKRRLVAEYGAHSVYYDPLAHVPWGLFRVYHGERYVGAQISWPSKSDCQWLDRWGHRYADSSFRDDKPYGYGAIKRGAAKRAFTIKRSRVAEVEEAA